MGNSFWMLDAVEEKYFEVTIEVFLRDTEWKSRKRLYLRKIVKCLLKCGSFFLARQSFRHSKTCSNFPRDRQLPYGD